MTQIAGHAFLADPLTGQERCHCGRAWHEIAWATRAELHQPGLAQRRPRRPKWRG